MNLAPVRMEIISHEMCAQRLPDREADDLSHRNRSVGEVLLVDEWEPSLLARNHANVDTFNCRLSTYLTGIRTESSGFGTVLDEKC